MAFNLGGQLGGQGNPAFGFSTPQTQSGAFQFGNVNPAFGTAGGQPATTVSSAFSFGATGGNPSFGTSVFGAPAAPTATGAPSSTFGGFGAATTGAPAGSFSFAAPAAPAFGTSGGGMFAAPAPAPTTSSAPSFFSGGGATTGGTFSFGATGTPAPAAAPQFGVAPTQAAGQPFNFSTPTTSTPSVFGGMGFSLGGGTPGPAPVVSTAPSILSGGTTFNFGGLGTGGTTANTVGGFQATPAAPTMPTLTQLAPAPTNVSAPTPFGTPFGAAGSSMPTLFPGGLGNTTAASVAPTFKPPATTPAATGFGILPSFSVPAATAAPPSLTFGTPAITKIPLTGFTPTVTTATTTNSALSFGALPTTVASVAPLSSISTSSSSSATPAAPNFSLGTSSLFTAPKPPPTTSTTPAISTVAATTTIVPLPSTTTTSTTTSAPTSLVAPPPAFTVSLLTSTSSSPTATTADTSGTVTVPGTQMTFRQLEEAINKWNLELGDQERIFLNQATQVNAWDRLLITNGLKIKDLHESVERVKLEQERLDHELDFIVSQQRELEDLLAPLEKALDDTPALSIQQHADLQREHTYHLAEKVDCQLKRMAEDIKQIIEHLNTSQNQDELDPMQQVSKILNAHMDALQWVDQNTELLQKKLEEVSKVMETTKKDQESSWRISYN